MQVDTHWKAAANLQLLLGEAHPPVRIEHDPIAPARPPRNATPQELEAIARRAKQGTAKMNARNTANFRFTAYCSLQDPNTPSVRHRLIAYYREMLQRVPLWRHRIAKVEQNTDAVKREPSAEENEGVEGSAARMDASGKAESTSAATGSTQPPQQQFRALGILTQVHDPIGEQAVVPWEFFVIQDINDDSCFDGPLNAMLKDIPQDRFPLLFASVRDPPEGLPSLQQRQDPRGDITAANMAAEEETKRQQYVQEGQRLSLYARMLDSFTGLYPGMAVGIIGDAFQRSARGVLTGVLLRDVVLPSRPVLPWRVERPLTGGLSSVRAGGNGSVSAGPKSTRVHFCSGPFPRRDIRALLRAVTRQALHRGADVLIIAGPLVKPFEGFEAEILPSVAQPFSEMLDGFVDSLEETLDEYYATRPNVPHMKVVLVSHPDDVTQAPVLPTTMYAMADTDDVLFRSNPCRIAVNGVHFAVCNEDVVGHMRDVMVERWPTAEGSLRRVVEALVQGRLYTPITELPMTRVDLKHLGALRMDCAPMGNELLELEKNAGDEAQQSNASRNVPPQEDSSNWNAVFQLESPANAGPKEEDPEGGSESLAKRVKREGAEDGAQGSGRGDAANSLSIKKDPQAQGTVTELMPHIMFLPSTRPQFAYVTHRGLSIGGGAVEDESSLDDTSRATGVLVVNQEVWSRRASPKFEMRVAEVTIKDSDLVVCRGASAGNGVACGVLHIFNADK